MNIIQNHTQDEPRKAKKKKQSEQIYKKSKNLKPNAFRDIEQSTLAPKRSKTIIKKSSEKDLVFSSQDKTMVSKYQFYGTSNTEHDLIDHKVSK